jgi:L-ascorbate metabolism protein UlaG (beta-lactamase superfamily)
MLNNLEWLGHATFRITGEKVIYIDPWKVDTDQKADIILVSHSHFDHFSQEDIHKLTKNDTVIVTVPELQNNISENSVILVPGQSTEIDGVKITAIPAYNKNKDYHQKSKNWLGFVVEVDGESLYYAGDTDIIPEMEELENIDVALLPVGGTYTMTAKEAADAAERISPGVAVPYHYGDIVGSKSDALKFEKFFSGKTKILTKTN